MLWGPMPKSATGSSQNEQVALFDEATSSELVPIPRNENPTPVAGDPNKGRVQGQWQIYHDAKMINDKEKMARLIIEERRVLTKIMHTVPDIHRIFNLHNEEIIWYASYATTLRGSISKRSKPIAQDPLTSTMVRGCPVDISYATINHFLYGSTTGHSWLLNAAEFDYRWVIVRSGAFQRNAEQWRACRVVRYTMIAYPKGYIKFCGQVLLVVGA
ncbi:hypothetical protein H5410_003436 [Solanum commersonii]|uniref:Uncharacterized protein n=1 Tax=Solanum commersonii TaxID=4109 RepID=A0A9J6B5N2_SOLCO|nr:hypothetical protein H5410_003436 [Solanum commersonii]